MTIRDIKILLEIIQNKIDLGLPIIVLLIKNFKKIQNIEILFFQMELILFMNFLTMKVKLRIIFL